MVRVLVGSSSCLCGARWMDHQIDLDGGKDVPIWRGVGGAPRVSNGGRSGGGCGAAGSGDDHLYFAGRGACL